MSPPSSVHDPQSRPRKLRLLIVANGPRDAAHAEAIAVRLSKDPNISTRALVDDMTHRLASESVVLQNRSVKKGPATTAEEADNGQREAHVLVEWADLLVLAPLDADNMAKMMCGIADTLLLEVLRSWDTSKRILLVPGMTKHMWENPVTKRQLSKLHRKWSWVRVMPPILWHYEDPERPSPPNRERQAHGTPTLALKRKVVWDAFGEVVSIIKNQADLLLLGHDVEVAVQKIDAPRSNGGPTAVLPPEILSIVFEYANDWELAAHIGIFTRLEMPTNQGWRSEPKDPNDPLQVYNHELEWTILTGSPQKICRKLSLAPSSFHDLSALAVHLILKLNLCEVLSYIETNCPQVFKCFDGKTIPTKASAYYGRTDILDWWARSPSFLEKYYDNEALNGASAKGFIHVLQWWRRSNLPLKFNERAMEQASSKGHLHVLEWWKEAAHQDPKVVLKPGRSLLGAVQYGHTAVIRWWEDSGITVGFHEQVCKMASRWGQVKVLELWRALRGDDKLQFDAQILSEPTIHAHIDVLDWWCRYAHGELPGMKGKGKRVEYKIMDIEEALDDSVGDQKKVRRWWAEQGLNLRVGTSEWMAPKSL
ncbi:hypothetical protein P8C59_008680 [Phyllachora maydis]|uniref:Flavoprotein domain-containing protein n=1 Tax=Phyllachora maydis TaxID=1825666 RepID=A0AAD9MEU6_9PEZI|nr:hypothetical protein P8C59_008680 [Phyllachora maydis]